PLLGRSDQTVCELSRKARLAVAGGGEIAELIERSRQILEARVRATEPPAPAGTLPRRAFALLDLRLRRTQADFTQLQLALRSGIARETIVRIENGRPAR